MNIVQLLDPQLRPRVAVVEEPRLRLLQHCESLHQLATSALRSERPLGELIASTLSSEALDYDPIYHGYSEWRLRPPILHPLEPTRVIVSGTGLTHRRSAANRQAMHTASSEAPVTDSMRMYDWGVEGGRPQPGRVGVQPEWFYKGSGYCLRGHGEPLVVPPYAEDGGEEAEVAGVYIVDGGGQPRRVGFVTGNEFSDHVMERRNYLYLAPSKLRSCAIGPELALDHAFDDLRG
ncbi:MAG TPA: GguC protein, partial [Bryobacteraceae bacterium]|nr:GguC protein [Bryobacteraceae bacterium]